MKYRVLEIIQASAFGEIMRIQIQNKSLNENKQMGSENEQEERKGNDLAFSSEIFYLTMVQQSKFSKEEKRFCLS